MSEDKEEDDKFERKRERQRFIAVIVIGALGSLAGYSLLYDADKVANIIFMLFRL